MAIRLDHRHLRSSVKQQLFVVVLVWVSTNLSSLLLVLNALRSCFGIGLYCFDRFGFTMV